MYSKFPQISIIDSNTLAAIGLKSILQNIIPMMSVEIFNSTQDLLNAQPDKFYHYLPQLTSFLKIKTFT